jgi:hypothetical protein
VIGSSPWPLTDKTAKPISGLEVEDGTMTPTYWERHGRYMSGYVVTKAGEAIGMAVYDFTTGGTRQLNRDSRTYDVGWLPDGRHVLYFTDRGQLVVQDVETLERHSVAGALAYPPDILRAIAVAPDGRTLYYGATQSQANIWLIKRSDAKRGSR